MRLLVASETANKIILDEKAHERISKARREGETDSDVVLRLSDTKVAGLQSRGEGVIMSSDERKLLVPVIEDKCMGAESCVMVAPHVFSLDTKQLGMFSKGNAPLGMKETVDRTVDSETIVLAAKSCPYKAIYVKDAETGEDLARDPW